MTPVERVLAEIRAIATDEHDKGDRFERLILHALQTDRTFRQEDVSLTVELGDGLHC